MPSGHKLHLYLRRRKLFDSMHHMRQAGYTDQFHRICFVRDYERMCRAARQGHVFVTGGSMASFIRTHAPPARTFNELSAAAGQMILHPIDAHDVQVAAQLGDDPGRRHTSFNATIRDLCLHG
jgi:hypothetical protein